MNLRGKIGLISSLITLIALAVLGFVVGNVINKSRGDDLRQGIEFRANAALKVALSATEDTMPVFDTSTILASGAKAAWVYIDGRLVWSGGDPHAPQLPDPEFVRGTAANHACECSDWYVYGLRRANLVVQIAEPFRPIHQTVQRFAQDATTVGLIAAVLAGVLSVFMVSQTIRPLNRLTARVENLESANPIPGLERRDEVGTLARALDHGLDSLRQTRLFEQRFLANASHELRGPITALIADLEHTLERPRPPAEDRAALTRIHRSANYLQDLCNNLLALSHSNLTVPTRNDLDLLPLASDVVDRLMPLATRKGLLIDMDGLPAKMRGDWVLLSRLIENLIGNAIKYTNQGLIRVDVRPLDPTSHEPQQIILTVTDTGIGIPADKLKGIFQPFQRANLEHRDGFGLGLAVVESVVEAHGGRTEIVSQVHKGTQVKVFLPTHLEPVPEFESLHHKANATHQITLTAPGRSPEFHPRFGQHPSR
jgi:signal transduction histidine kinase